MFIPFLVFGFWSLLVTKLRKYKNITQSFFAFCKARWARWKKRKEYHATKVTKNQKTKIWNERNKIFTIFNFGIDNGLYLLAKKTNDVITLKFNKSHVAFLPVKTLPLNMKYFFQIYCNCPTGKNFLGEICNSL